MNTIINILIIAIFVIALFGVTYITIKMVIFDVKSRILAKKLHKEINKLIEQKKEVNNER